MSQAQDTTNQCSKHHSDYIAVDISPQCEQEGRFLCLKCLLTTTNEKHNVKSLDEANIYLSDMKSAFLQKKSDQSKKNLAILKDLISSIQSLKTFYNSTLDKILENLKQQETLVAKEQEEINLQLQKVDLNNYFSQNYELDQLQYDQIKELTQNQIKNLEKYDQVNYCLKQLLKIDDSIFQLSPTQQLNAMSKKQIQRTPYLRVTCETHQMEIIYFDLNVSTTIENKIACALCASNKLGPFTDLLSAQKQWQEYENFKQQLLQQQLDKGKTKIDTTQTQLKEILNQFEIKINDVDNKLINNLIILQEKNQNEMNKMNKDWLLLQKNDVLFMADTLSKPQYLDILNKQLQEDFKKDNEELDSFIEDSLNFLMETFLKSNETIKLIYSQEHNQYQRDFSKIKFTPSVKLNILSLGLKKGDDKKVLVNTIEQLNCQIKQLSQEKQEQLKQSSNQIALLNKQIQDDKSLKYQTNQQIETSQFEINKLKTDLKTLTIEFNNLKQNLNNITKDIDKKNQKINESELREKQILAQIEKQNTIIQEYETMKKELDRVDGFPSYEILSEYSKSQADQCRAIAFNTEQTVMIAGYGNNKIIVFQFNLGKLDQRQILGDHTSNNTIDTLYFMTKQNQFISGSGKEIGIWSYNNTTQQYYCQQMLKLAHSGSVNRVIMNKNEDLIISCSSDYTIKFWIRKKEWELSQSLSLSFYQVNDICLNESCTLLASCTSQNIIKIYLLRNDGQWVLNQQINYLSQNLHGNRICFIGNNYLAYQCSAGQKTRIFQLQPKQENNQFQNYKDIPLQTDWFSYYTSQFKDMNLFPMKFSGRKQLLLNKNSSTVNIIRKQINDFFVQQTITFKTDVIFGAMTDDFKFLVTWDDSSKEFQVRTQK